MSFNYYEYADLTYIEQRGSLTYQKPDFSSEKIEGWFYVHPISRQVVARKPMGSRHWHICNESQVLSFSIRVEEEA